MKAPAQETPAPAPIVQKQAIVVPVGAATVVPPAAAAAGVPLPAQTCFAVPSMPILPHAGGYGSLQSQSSDIRRAHRLGNRRAISLPNLRVWRTLEIGLRASHYLPSPQVVTSRAAGQVAAGPGSMDASGQVAHMVFPAWAVQNPTVVRCELVQPAHEPRHRLRSVFPLLKHSSHFKQRNGKRRNRPGAPSRDNENALATGCACRPRYQSRSVRRSRATMPEPFCRVKEQQRGFVHIQERGQRTSEKGKL
ncbi:hypothetical protein V8E36_005939 [Tilletia maclaganii]